MYHVVALGAQTGHVTVDVERPLVADAIQHGVDDDEGARPTHASAAAVQTCTTLISMLRQNRFRIIVYSQAYSVLFNAINTFTSIKNF